MTRTRTRRAQNLMQKLCKVVARICRHGHMTTTTFRILPFKIFDWAECVHAQVRARGKRDEKARLFWHPLSETLKVMNRLQPRAPSARRRRSSCICCAPVQSAACRTRATAATMSRSRSWTQQRRACWTSFRACVRRSPRRLVVWRSVTRRAWPNATAIALPSLSSTKDVRQRGCRRSRCRECSP